MALKNLKQVAPKTEDQRAQYRKIQNDVMNVKNKVEMSIKRVKMDLEEKQKLEKSQEECQQIQMVVQQQELMHMVAQSRKLKVLVENHRNWVVLYKRLKVLQEEQVDSLDLETQKATQNQKKFQATINSEKKEDCEDYVRKIQK